MSLQDLITPKTEAEMLEEQITEAQGLGLDTTSWQSGSVVRTIILIMAAAFSAFSNIIVAPIRGGFGDLLTSIEWAKIWALNYYNVTAIESEPATGFIDATNATATEYTHPAGDLIVAHATTGKLYRNVEEVTILGNDTTEDIEISAVESGTGSNAAPAAITVVVGPTMNGVTITNPLSVLGSDAESVTALVTRSREKMGALSPDGPKEAYNYIAKTPEYSATATPITRATTIEDPVTGYLTIYIATANGAPISGDVAIVQAALELWAECWTATATAVAIVEREIDITYEIWVRSSFTSTQITDAIETAISEFIASIPIGGTVIPPEIGLVYRDNIHSVITSTLIGDTSIGVARATLTLPDADTDSDGDGVDDAIEIEEDEAAVLGTITATVNFLT